MGETRFEGELDVGADVVPFPFRAGPEGNGGDLQNRVGWVRGEEEEERTYVVAVVEWKRHCSCYFCRTQAGIGGGDCLVSRVLERHNGRYWSPQRSSSRRWRSKWSESSRIRFRAQRFLTSFWPRNIGSCRSRLLSLMRLLNTKTLKLAEFYADIPLYAILSHTWEKEEVTFQDIQNLETARLKAGFAKVSNACARARNYDFEWIWIDSCCINKESSAELSEAINSMYQYYEDAAVCYVYLCDVSIEFHPRNLKSTFKDSRWFKRGWTLQELLAPDHVVFLDKDWVRIGTRWTLRDVVSAITSIPVEVFEGWDINTYSVAQRMSWAASRETTRAEDQAYSLMGIFGVSMPPIYGEGGAKAFMRLQQEIIKISDDQSIFAWVAASSERNEHRGLLAKSPYEFRMSGEVKASESDCIGDRSSYSFGNNGLHIHLPLESIGGDDLFLASLLCQSERDGSFLSFALRKTSRHQYARCHPDQLVFRPTLQPALNNIQELTVREIPVTRRSRSYVSVDLFESLMYHVDLLPSAQHFICTNSQSWHVIHSPNLSRVSVRLQRPIFDCKLTYKTQVTEEAFTIHLWRGGFPCYVLQLGDQPLKWPPLIDESSPDDGTVVCSNSGAISVHSEVTSDRSARRFEIGVIDRDSLEINFWTQTLRPPRSGFIVPSMYYGPSEMIPLVGVYPFDFYQKTFQDMAYIPMSPTDDPFRILTYGRPGTPSFHVAIGLLGPSCETYWTEVMGDGESVEQLYQSYLNRSRADKLGQLGQTSTWSDSLYVGSLIASVQERSSLRLGTHLLRLEWIWGP
ncbi:hypothetical protein D9758_017524 [Tetrapyrgos nigripes]|uniref:HET-domain-containing protein n=1 Tax=Tetrapyrgos nigripes TaxID=182062 RepID=A0A8H5C2F6_9AGAR|nr:hypothetical protein D9758_017524 [Tetrapyrgos nigripes]